MKTLLVYGIFLTTLVTALSYGAPPKKFQTGTIYYLEIVSRDADRLVPLYERSYGFKFAKPDADLGNARVAARQDGTLVGIRKPLAEDEKPVMRSYLVVDDVQKAVDGALASGASEAYPPTTLGAWGKFAIVIQGDVQHGFWQP